MNISLRNLILYILKCLTGCIFLLWLSKYIPSPDANWAIVSALLVFSPNNEEALPFAITRIKANVIGGFSSFLCLLVLPPGVITICISLILTITACYGFKIMDGSRSAIAAVIIIMVHDMTISPSHFWTTTLYRIGFVIAGCLTGLLVTFIFHRQVGKRNKIISADGNKGGD